MKKLLILFKILGFTEINKNHPENYHGNDVFILHTSNKSYAFEISQDNMNSKDFNIITSITDTKNRNNSYDASMPIAFCIKTLEYDFKHQLRQHKINKLLCP